MLLQWVWQRYHSPFHPGDDNTDTTFDWTAHTLNTEQSGTLDFWYDIPTNAYYIVRLRVLSLRLWHVYDMKWDMGSEMICTIFDF